MKTITRALKLAAVSLMLFAFTGCESTDSGSVSGSVYYGTAFYDPWYYGDYCDDVDVIVTPPDRPTSPPPVPCQPSKR